MLGFFLCEGSKIHRAFGARGRLEAQIVAKAGFWTIWILPISIIPSLPSLNFQPFNHLPQRLMFVHLQTLGLSQLFQELLALYPTIQTHPNFSLILPRSATSLNVQSNFLIATLHLSIRSHCNRISTTKRSSILMRLLPSDAAMVYQYPTVTISIPRKVTTNPNFRQQDGGPNVQPISQNLCVITPFVFSVLIIVF